MKCNIFRTCSLIFVIFGSYQGVTGHKPTIISDGDVVYVNEGDELKIKCRSESKPQFSTQRLLGNYNQSEFTDSFDDDSRIYTFIRHRTITADTGWYGCAEEGVKIRNDDQTIERQSEDISWIYVYVSSSQPFAAVHIYEIIPAVEGNVVVIPCRPTSPNLNVQLYINDGYLPVPDDTPYDPKIGFIVKNVTAAQTGETYTCKISGYSEEDGTEIYPRYLLQVERQSQLPKPVIDERALRHVVPGKNMILKCKITVPVHTSVHLSWSIPDSVPEERLHHDPEIVLPDRDTSGGKTVYTRQVTVENVESNYGGEYTCRAQGIAERVSISSINIKIWDPSDTYINVSMTNGVSSISLSEGKDAQWRIEIDTYPENFQWQWFKPDGSQIPTNIMKNTGKYRFRRTGVNHFFIVSDLVLSDSGNYTLKIFTENDKRNVVLGLIVESPPVTEIEKTLSHYAPGKLATFTCRTIGLPLPTITWNYVEYPDFPSKENFLKKSLTNIQDTRESHNIFKLSSTMSIMINKTGDLVCRTCNNINCTEAFVSIFVSDRNRLFDLQGPDSEPVTKGDNVSLTCSVNIRNFTDEITWKYSRFDKIERLPEKIRILENKMNSTLRSILEIRDVTMFDSGIYFCEAKNKTGKTQKRNYNLDVMDTLHPRITETNLNKSKVIIKLNTGNEQLTLSCITQGRPTARVTWFRDDQLLVNNNQYHFSPTNSTLHIRFFRNKNTGRYLCRAKNRLGSDERYIDIVIEESHDNIIWISLICALIIIVIIVITYMIIKVRREKRLRKELLDAGLTHFREGALESLNPDLTVDEQVELLPYDNKWEFPREQLKLGKQLGSGAFGVVMKAEARGICEGEEVTIVAVKMVRRSAEPSYMKALSSELKIMIHLGRHINVVNLLGACTKTIITKRELLVIVEYCQFGNLHNYLQRHRDSFIDQIVQSTQTIDLNIGSDSLNDRRSSGSQNKSKYTGTFSPSVSTNSSNSTNGIELVDYRDINMSPDGGVLSNNSSQPGWRSNYRGDYKDTNLKPICTQDLLCWAWQVSRGMEYLSSRNVLHGDLAARNILLADDNVVKICDFGLAKNMYKDDNYKKTGDGPLPIKWMAIESIRDRMFSTQSDVWSFGIVLWEFFTLARSPYPGMEAEKQYDRLIDGYRLEKPKYATDKIYDFMLDCWKAEPYFRPTFPELVEKIGNLLNEQLKTHYSDLNAPYMNMNSLTLKNDRSDYLTMMSPPNHNYCNSPDSVVEVHSTDTSYVPMNRLNEFSKTRICTPHPKHKESHFEFPSSDQLRTIDIDLKNSTESVPIPTRKVPHVKSTNLQQVRTNFMEHDEEKNVNEKHPGYCNIAMNPHYANLNNRLATENAKSSNSSASKIKPRKNSTKKVSSPTMSGFENRIIDNERQKNDLPKNHTADSAVSNFSYMIMPKNERK